MKLPFPEEEPGILSILFDATGEGSWNERVNRLPEEIATLLNRF